MTLFTVQVAKDFGLVPFSGTLPAAPTSSHGIGCWNDEIFLNKYGANGNSPYNATVEPPPIIDIGTITSNAKTSSSTTTKPPREPQPSPWDFEIPTFQQFLKQVLHGILRAEAALALAVVEFIRTHPPMTRKYDPVIVKTNQKGLQPEAELLAFRVFNRRQWRSQRRASVRRKPGVRFRRAPKSCIPPTEIPDRFLDLNVRQVLGLQEVATISSNDKAIQTSLPPSPTSEQALSTHQQPPPPPASVPKPPVPSSIPRFSFRPGANEYIPVAPRPRVGPLGPTTYTPEEFKLLYPRHGST
ncbi:MAG: hypothetical protein Q9219_003256 [cf. Caloplaca sp. 3 TL-2023]